MSTFLAPHPALVAWLALGGGPSEARVTALQERDGRAAYLIEAHATTVVAKRSDEAGAAAERLVYEEVLPRLGLSAPRFLGSLGPWLFVEHVGATAFAPELPEHRRAAARWLGTLHAAAAALPLVGRVPDRTAAYYRERLEAARTALVAHLGNPALRHAERATLVAAAVRCDEIAARWADVEALAAAVPATLVHGDFHPRNVRVRGAGDGLELLPFDWGSAGWGTPAEDVACVDLDVYRAVGRPQLDSGDLFRLAKLGRLFRMLALVAWNEHRLASPWAAEAVHDKVGFYAAWIDDALRALGWTD